MSKCELSIELTDDANQWRRGGDTVSGRVIVNALENLKCNGLTISANWKTHGRGNISKGNGETKTLFAGEWSAGQREEYPFEIRLVDGPPTYHGHYISVDHYLTANVDVPWAFDPKISLPIPVRVGPTWTNENPAIGKSSSVIVGIIFALVMLLVVGAVGLAMGAIGFLIGGVIIAILGGIALVRIVLPKWQLGNVMIQWDGPAAPGQLLTGRCIIDPKKRLLTGPLTVTFEGTESATSGSGSNRRTHKHELFAHPMTLADTLELKPGLRVEVPIEIQVDSHAPPSFKLGDNELHYHCKFQIEIARWPDWRRTENVTIVPAVDNEGSVTRHPGSGQSDSTNSVRRESRDGSDSKSLAISFDELSALLWEHRDSPDDRDRLMVATTGLHLFLSVEIERRLLYTGDDPHVPRGDYAVWAHAASDPPLPLVLYIRHDQGDEFENASEWSGQGEILGWDDAHRRLRIRTLSGLPNAGLAT